MLKLVNMFRVKCKMETNSGSGLIGPNTILETSRFEFHEIRLVGLG